MAPNKEDWEERWYTIKHYCARGRTVHQVYEILKETYGDNDLVCSTVYWWHDAFLKEGTMNAKLKGGPSVPTTKLMKVLVNTVAIIMQEKSWLTMRELAQTLQIAPSTARILLTEKLRLSRVCWRWILHSLTEEQCAEHAQIWRMMLAKWEHENVYFDNVVTCDKSRVYHYIPKMKQQSTRWVKKWSALPKKVCAQKFQRWR